MADGRGWGFSRFGFLASWQALMPGAHLPISLSLSHSAARLSLTLFVCDDVASISCGSRRSLKQLQINFAFRVGVAWAFWLGVARVAICRLSASCVCRLVSWLVDRLVGEQVGWLVDLAPPDCRWTAGPVCLLCRLVVHVIAATPSVHPSACDAALCVRVCVRPSVCPFVFLYVGMRFLIMMQGGGSRNVGYVNISTFACDTVER